MNLTNMVLILFWNNQPAVLDLTLNLVLHYFSGVLSHKAVREKIVRAFLIEEQKLVNLLMRDQGAPKAEK